jgi:hypothetical protein
MYHYMLKHIAFPVIMLYTLYIINYFDLKMSLLISKVNQSGVL